MKNIGVLWDDEIDMSSKKPFDEEEWNVDYEVFSNEAKKQNVELFLTNFRQLEDSKLKSAYVYRDNKWRKVKNINLDGIFDKYKFDEETLKVKKKVADVLPVVNNPELEELCKDKLATYERFPKFVPETRKADGENVREFIDMDGKAVIKPRYDFGGRGIQIVENFNELDEVDSEAFIVQRFVDASGGIPETEYESIHDIRSILVSGELVSGFVRMPDEGLISNVMQGGSMEVFSSEDYSKDVREVIEKVAEDLEEYEPSVYSVDLVYDQNGNPRVVELNSKPSLSFHKDEELKESKLAVFRKILDIFKSF